MIELRHLLATIAYRLRAVVAETTDEFGSFEAGLGTRSPRSIVRHMTSVLRHAQRVVGDVSWREPKALAWRDEQVRFGAELRALDQSLGAWAPSDDQHLRLLQGPLADVLTHVGQVAMLRRLFGSPVPGENFMAATIMAGQLLD